MLAKPLELSDSIRPAARRGLLLASGGVGVLALAAALTIALAGSHSGQSGSPAFPGHVRFLGRVPATQQIDLTIVLRLRDSAGASRAESAINDPNSPQFHHFLSPGAFGARYGLPVSVLGRIERALARRGLRVTASYPQRTALALAGSAGSVESLLQVSIGNYGDGAHRWRAPLTKPALPPWLAKVASSVAGLDTRSAWQPRDVPLGGLTPSEAGIAYDLAPLHAQGYLGQHSTIAIVSFSDYSPTDAAKYDQRFGIKGPPPGVIRVDGGTTDDSGADETNLDINVIRAVAPLARILVYVAPQSSTSYTDTINKIVADRAAQVVSSSWGQCELGIYRFESAGDTQAIRVADAAGISIFAASGDSGAYDCESAQLTDRRLSVDWPAASAGVIAVGGTRLYLNQDGTYLREAGWEYALSGAGGGGGLAQGDARPSWQTGPGVSNAYSNGHRQLPDVSADADPATGWTAYSTANGEFAEIGGTSAATPFWAASTLLVSEYARARGVGKLGFVDPTLYALAATPQPFPAFHDVLAGGNRYYQATPGWDYATGLGSPDVYNLARDTTAYLQAHRR